MYFGIIGEHQELAEYALSYLHATDITFIKKHIVTFQTSLSERLSSCASLIKRGKIVTTVEESGKEEFSDTVGVADKIFGSKLKKKYESIKRFKVVELIHTDLEIKESGTEIVEINNTTYGIVLGYQNIALYETIDFQKPIGGMSIGMMPSKLALTLINIGIGQYETHHKGLIDNSKLTIWDPFCGFGTTNFLANHIGYHTIGSDINPTQAKQNWKRRSEQTFFQDQNKSTFLKHDVTQAFKNPIFRHGDVIVSEGWLGHIVTHKTAQNEVKLFSADVASVYKKFFDQLTELYKQNNKLSLTEGGIGGITIIITIPTWLKHEISISESIQDHANSLGRTTKLLEKPYSREKQLVGRQVLIAYIS